MTDPVVPGPPDDYSEEERRAWLEGAAEVAEILGTQNAIIAETYSDQIDESDNEGETCECGAEKIDGLGGAICPECNT
jgi:hypothetical protein